MNCGRDKLEVKSQYKLSKNIPPWLLAYERGQAIPL